MTRDNTTKTSKLPFQTTRKFSAWVRDQLYDFIFTEGDFALQMVGDLFRGYELKREIKHLERQVRHQQTRVSSPSMKQSGNHQKTTHAQKPLSRKDQQTFLNILKRENGEGQIEYWKRKKWMLALPTDAIREMLRRRQELDQRQTAQDIQVESYNITQNYQQRLAMRQQRRELRAYLDKRYRKRGR